MERIYLKLPTVKYRLWLELEEWSYLSPKPGRETVPQRDELWVDSG